MTGGCGLGQGGRAAVIGYRRVMRWQELFADLEAQAHSMERAGDDSEIAERIRGEVARVTLVNRLRAQITRPVTVSVWGAGELSGVLERVGADWLLIAAEGEAIVPLSAVMALLDLPPEAVAADGAGVVSGKLRLASVLRAIARDRSPVTVLRRDGKSLTGTPDRVGADFVDLALHDVGETPRHREIRSRATVGFDAIACICRRPVPSTAS